VQRHNRLRRRLLRAKPSATGIQHAHITNITAVKYSRIFTNIKTDHEYYNLPFVLAHFLEEQSPSNCIKPTIVYYCLVMEK